MPYLKKKIEKDFTTVHNTFLRDTKLGIGARGLLMTMMSMTDGWKFSVKGLAKILPDGEKKISSALNSLKENGYLRLNRITAPNGRVLEWEYLFADYPAFKEDDSDDDNENSKSNEQQPKSKKSEAKSKKALNTKSAKKTNNSINSPHLQKADVENADMDNADVKNGGIYQISNNQISKNQISFNQSINQAAEKNQPNLTETKLIDGLIDKKTKQMTYSEKRTKQMTYFEMLQTIGSSYCYDAESEEYFTSFNEHERYTDECSIPYNLTTDTNAMTQALKYLFSYSYHANKMTNEEINVLDSVIKAMTELMTQDTSKISGRIVKYREIIDIVNDIVKNSSLMEWYGFFDYMDGFKQHWENVLARKLKNGEQIPYPYAFLKSCIANYLLDYKVHGTMDTMTANGLLREEYGHDINSNGFDSDKYDCCVNAFDIEKTTIPEKSNTPVQSEPTIQKVQSESADISAIQTDNQEIQEHSEQPTVNIDEFLTRLKGETDEQNEQKKKIEEQNKRTQLKNILFFKQMYDEAGEPLPKYMAEILSEYEPEYIKEVIAEIA